MDRCLIVFDLDTAELKDNYHNASWQNAYADIKRILAQHGFNNIQGTVYLGDDGVREAHGTLALQQVAIQCDWFDKCISDIRFYQLSDDFDAQFIVDGVTRARAAFVQRLSDLEKSLKAAGLSDAQVKEILGNEKFLMPDNTIKQGNLLE